MARIRFPARSLLVGLILLLAASVVSIANAGASISPWMSQQTPEPSTPFVLSGEAWRSPHDAWAVGTRYSGGICTARTLIEHWDGTGWSIVPSPSPGTCSWVMGVDALSATDAWAVGSFTATNGNGYPQTLIEHWDGTGWSVVPSPNLGHDSELDRVDARSANDVWAIGGYYASGGRAWDYPMIEHWDGTRWSVEALPLPCGGTSQTRLGSVQAVSRGNVWVVGGCHVEQGSDQILIEHWDGEQWSSPLRTLSPLQGWLEGLSVAATEGWAVGYRDGVPYLPTLIEHWNGSTWSTMDSPSAEGEDNFLLAVDTGSPSDAWAVGTQHDSHRQGAAQTLIEHWDGSAWSIVPSPNVGTGNNGLDVVHVNTATRAWAMGVYADSNGVQHPLIERWNGVSWKVVP